MSFNMKRKPRTRINDLPDQVVHHILSFLTFIDLTRFGTVSRNCRELYLSVPYLNFAVDKSITRSIAKRTNLINSMERYLLHRGNSAIIRFRLSWEFRNTKPANKYYEEQFRLASWIQNAVRCNVQEIELNLSKDQIQKFAWPSCVFSSASLRSLVVDSGPIFQVPSVSFSNKIRCLNLSKVQIAFDDFGKCITRCFKCIKELSLESIHGLGHGLKNITIESSSLEFVGLAHLGQVCLLDHINILCNKLEVLHINEVFWDSRGSSLKIYAPNLKHIRWTQSNGRKLMNRLHIGNSMCLDKVELFLGEDFNKLKEVLSGFRRTKLLVLDRQTLKNMSNEGILRLPPLDEICGFKLYTYCLEYDLVPAVVSLLREMSNLNTLSITTDNLPPTSRYSYHEDFASGFDMSYWKSQELAFVSQLKEVRIELSTNGSNELDFAKYLLEHAHNLKKMVILYPPQQCPIRKKINRKMSVTNAKLAYEKRKKKKKKKKDD